MTAIACSTEEKKVCLILGIGGQDGSYLAEYLLSQGHEVLGLYRRSSVDNLGRIRGIKEKVKLYPGDITDYSSLSRILQESSPNEVYNLADQDHVGWSYATPLYSHQVTYGGVANLLEICRTEFSSNQRPRIFQASSALMLGGPSPQTEQSPLEPRSPYAVAKAAAHLLCQYYREHHGVFVSTGILFNHDSPRREGNYLLHQIARQVLQIQKGKQNAVTVGDPEMFVSIGSAEDYVRAFPLILRHTQPDDFAVGIPNCWKVRGVTRRMLREVFSFKEAEFIPILQDPAFLRPGKQLLLSTRAEKAGEILGWTGDWNNFQELLPEIIRKYSNEL